MFSIVSAVFPGENSTQAPEHLSSLGSSSTLDAGIASIPRSTASLDAGIAFILRSTAGLAAEIPYRGLDRKPRR